MQEHLTSDSFKSYPHSDLMSAAHSSRIARKSFEVVRQTREREKAKLYTVVKARNWVTWCIELVCMEVL